MEEVSEEGVSLVQRNGFVWYRDKLMPAIEKAEILLPNHTELIADCYYVIGDTHDLNDAPLTAIKFYKKALSFDPNFAAVYREIGNMMLSMGQRENAISNLKKALSIDPEDENAKSDLANAMEQYEKGEEVYEKGDQIWDSCELMANGHFEEVLTKLDGSSNIKELQILARSFGAINNHEEYLRTWNSIERTSGKLELNYADWFYLPAELYESDQIWIIFKRLINRFEFSIFVQFDSLNHNYSKIISPEKLKELVCDFQIYDNTNNQLELEKLKTQYPLWEDLNN